MSATLTSQHLAQFPFGTDTDTQTKCVPSLQRSGAAHASADAVPVAPREISTANSGEPTPAASTQTEACLVALLNSDPSACRRIALAVEGATAIEWAKARLGAEADTRMKMADGAVPKPTAQQLWHLHVRSAVPFIGFGFFDNMIMLTVGGAIENTIGVAFCLSSLAAAGMGQMVSDAAGITLQGLIERSADSLGLPQPRLTLQQQQLRSVQTFVLGSRIFGIILGCCFGMFPLLFMPEAPRQRIADQIAEKLPAQQRKEFVSLVSSQKFSRDEKILEFGEMSNYVLFIEKGQLECIGRDADGQPFHICTIEAGHSFGKPQLHCRSRVDLIAKDDDVVVQYMEKDDFVRLTGEEGMEVWESTQQAEHTVYFASLGRQVADPVGPALPGAGKTRMFASLPQKDKLKVLELADVPDRQRFQGIAKEGKCAAFAQLPENVKHEALSAWQSIHKRRHGKEQGA